MNQDNIISILWTGGWDSTYRIVELSMRNVMIRPIYVRDPDRISSPYEIKAMNEIVALLRNKEQTKATIKPVTIISTTSIPQNEEITKAWLFFKRETDLGLQHDWLARLALQYPMMEVCIEKAVSEHAPGWNSITRYGKLKDTRDGYVIDQKKSSEELNLIFGNLRLPTFDKTERDMLRNIKEWHYEDVMSHIWFCHDPIGGKPCGLCNPCITKMSSGMEFLLPEKAKKRNIRMRVIRKYFGNKAAGIYKKIVRQWEKTGK